MRGIGLGGLGRLLASPSSKVAFGSVLGHTVSLLAMPIISRIYGPSAVGLFATCLAIATVAGSVISLRLERVLALPSNNRDAARLAMGGIGFAFLFSVLGSLIGVVAVLLWFDSSIPVVLGTSLLTFFSAVGAILLQYAVRQRSYVTVAKRNGFQPCVTAAGQILLGIFGPGPLSLIMAASFGKLAGLLSLLRLAISDLGPWDRDSHCRGLFELLLRYRSVILLGSVAGLANTASLQILVPITGFYFSSEDSGFVAMSVLLFSAPIVVIGNAIGQVFLGDFAESVRSSAGTAGRVFRRASAVLAVMGLLLGVGVAVGSPFVIPILLGDQWSGVASVSVALAPLFGARFAVSPLAHTLVVLEKQAWQLSLDACRLAGIVAVFVTSSIIGLSLVECMFMYAVWSSLIYLIQWLLCFGAVKVTV